MEGLNLLLAEAIKHGDFHSINISQGTIISHILFVDDIIIFCNGSMHEVGKLFEVLTLFGKEIGM